jgi:hypothetical protein
MKDAGTGILGFISQIISSVVWPVTVLTCVILMRSAPGSGRQRTTHKPASKSSKDQTEA